MAKINVFALGGLDEKQRRLYVLEIDSKLFIIDSGVYEPLNNEFGIQHFIPNMDYLKQNRDKIKAIFLSAANRMNIGSLLQVINIKNDIEIYGSKPTLDSLDIFLKHDTKDWNKIEIKKGEIKNVAGIEVKGIDTPSMIPGTLGFQFITDDGNILYLSDYIFDTVREFGVSPFGHLAKLGTENNLLLLSDSSNSTEKAALSSKFRIRNLVKRYLKRPNRFVITIYEDEILNIVELIKLARENKRKIFVKSKTLLKLLDIFKKDGVIEDFPIRHYSEYQETDRENSIVILSGTRTKLYKTVELIIEAHNKEDFAFEQEDIVYFAAVPQAGNEHVFADVTNKISRIDPEFHKPEKEDKKTFGTTEFDIRNMINLVKPKYFFPISAYFTQLDASKQIAIENGVEEKNVIMADNGDIFTINKGVQEGISFKIKEIEPKVVESIGEDSVDNELIEERKIIGKDGIVTISFIYNNEKLVVCSDIDIQMKGVVISKGQEETLEKIKELILRTSDIQSETKQNVKKAIPSLRKEINKLFRQSINKVPTLMFNIMEV